MKNKIKYLSVLFLVALSLTETAQTFTPGGSKPQEGVQEADSVEFFIMNQHCNRPYAELYPNPLYGNTLKVKSGNIIKSVEIKNIIGQCIYLENNRHLVRDDMTIVLGKREPGIYSARITFEDNSFIIKKLIIR